MISRSATGCIVLASVSLVLDGAAVRAQEVDNAIFHYSQLQVDASRSPGPPVGRWEGAGWIGNDFDRLWWSTDGELADGTLGEAEAIALYGHYARRFWDVVVGVRQDFEPMIQTYLGFGIMGLAPYWFEVRLLGFVSQGGRPSVRFEAENDMYLTQRLVLQPALHADWLVTPDDRLDVPAGIATLELGLRVRYEIRRKLAPYVDMTWVREEESRAFVAGALETEGLRLGVGLRLIY